MMSHGTCPCTLLHVISFFTNNTRHAAQHTTTVSFVLRLDSRSPRSYDSRCVALAVAHAVTVAAQWLGQPTTPVLAHKLQVGNQWPMIQAL